MLPNLKKLRAEKGISQQKLAEIIGVSQPSINKYENHNIEPEIEILKRMASYFDTSIDYIVGYTDIDRKIESAQDLQLNKRERRMIARYRRLRDVERECIDMTLKVFSEENES